VLTFSAPFPGSSTAAAIWAVLTYGVLGIIYSVVNVPYGALAAVMSESPQDRVGLNSWRIGFTQFANVLLALVTVPMVVFFSGAGDGKTETAGGYLLTVVVLAAVAVILLLLVFATSKEVIAPVAGPRVPFRSTLRVLLTNGPLGLVFLGSLLIYTSFFGRLGVVIYYFLYNVQNFALISVFMAVPAAGAVIGIIAFTRFATRFGKRNLLIVMLAVQGLSLIALYLVGWSSTPAIIAISFVYGLALSGLPLVISMIPDVVDWTEDRTGVRADGTFYASFSFSTKLSSAIGGSAGIGLLAAVGFVANAHQSASALAGINAVANLGPALISLVGIIPFALYRISEQKVAEARARLDAKAAQLARD
jgi:GPH family glycoside/pentoside/hexuronide:cation symporter/probable glucitol transport protein GutA